MKKQHFFTLLLISSTAPLFAQFEVGSKAVTGFANFSAGNDWGTQNINTNTSVNLGLSYMKFRKPNQSLNFAANIYNTYSRTSSGSNVSKLWQIQPQLAIGTTRWIPLTFITPHLYGTLGHQVYAGYLYNYNKQSNATDSVLYRGRANAVSVGYEFSVGLAYMLKKRWLLSTKLGSLGGYVSFWQQNRPISSSDASRISANFTSSFSPAAWTFGISYFLKGGEQ